MGASPLRCDRARPPRSANRAVARAEGFVQELGQPQSCDTKLSVEDRLDVAKIAVVQHVVGATAVPNDRSQSVRLLRPVDEGAAIDSGARRFGALEPAILEPIDVGAPVKDDFLDQAEIPG